MSDIYGDYIKECKLDIIDNLENFCNMFNLEMPNMDIRWREDILLKKSNDFRKNFWESIKKK